MVSSLPCGSAIMRASLRAWARSSGVCCARASRRSASASSTARWARCSPIAMSSLARIMSPRAQCTRAPIHPGAFGSPRALTSRVIAGPLDFRHGVGTAVLRGSNQARRRNHMPVNTSSRSDLDTLLDLNRDYIRSVQTSDVRRFDEILAEDFFCSNPDGSLVDRDGFLSQTARPVKITNLEAHDVKVRIMGPFAIIHARTTYAGPDGREASGRYTDVWARRDGRWLAVSAHVTRC